MSARPRGAAPHGEIGEMPKVLHPYIDVLEPYEPPDLEGTAARAGMRVGQLIRLDANENPYGPSPRVAQALAEYRDYAYYPDYRPLREGLARYAGVAPEQVVLGNGADELIDLLIRLLVEPGQMVITCPPTFMYRFFIKVNRCRPLPVPRRDDFSLDVEGVEQAVAIGGEEVRLLFLASPGNPHGLATPLNQLGRLLALPMVVAVDEAYIEFGGESAASLLNEHTNLVVIRTFSKWAGLAGIRLGYALLAPELAEGLERIRAPYNVNAAAVVAGLATLADLETVQANVARLVTERERLRKRLGELGWLDPLPSQASFLLCRLEGRTGHEVREGLARRGILVRSFSDLRLASYIRITVGRPEQNDALMEALRAL